MKKAILQVHIEQAFTQTIDWYKNQSEATFLSSRRKDKWNAAQHLDHLVKSGKPVAKCMEMGSKTLQGTFGKIERTELEFEALRSKYLKSLNEGIVVDGSAYEPVELTLNDKEILLGKIDRVRMRMIQALENWSEEDLSQAVIPHPILGALSVREMIYFTCFHTKHHLHLLETHYDN